MTDLGVNQRKGMEIRVTADHRSAYKARLVDNCLTTHLEVHLHFTLKHSF